MKATSHLKAVLLLLGVMVYQAKASIFLQYMIQFLGDATWTNQ